MTTPVVSYLGWHGYRNLGDDAIYDAVTGQLPGVTMLDLPRQPQDWVAATLSGKRRALRDAPLLVGGGTILGRRHWRYMIGYGLSQSRHAGGYAIGVGVEDAVFQGRRSGSGRDELSRWGPLLSRLRKVSVRGPRSATLLADMGFDADVSGDPALLLPRPDVRPEEGRIGVNVGFGDDLWGHDPGALAAQLAVAVDDLRSRGHEVVGILMNEADRKWTRTALGDDGVVIAPATPEEAAVELGRCSLAIVTRLHAGILAALSGSPVLTLEYQPKCRDFAASIDDEQWLLRTDAVTSGAVLDLVTGMLGEAAAIRDRKLAAVQSLRSRLQTDYEQVRTQLQLAG
ncbi:polysaccharide pyruvyl transferase [Mycolicibacterium madagascariense]|uniref:Polysaccharide pyruvyl transferase n=1 Tax=Mycolicibacterium madagascariense TaxID=212765 RepID=A0A7I7XGN9_9MYCO|nr:polysaccharide pyruvyl transferase family protein [Mycolicibacterium madagascariense]BBZ28356.1 polysaccharide pyruvyl transferase [Mycolicibacterium madagascariense]